MHFAQIILRHFAQAEQEIIPWKIKSYIPIIGSPSSFHCNMHIFMLNYQVFVDIFHI